MIKIYQSRCLKWFLENNKKHVGSIGICLDYSKEKSELEYVAFTQPVRFIDSCYVHRGQRNCFLPFFVELSYSESLHMLLKMLILRV